MGLINKVVPEGQLEKETMELASQLADKPPIALQSTKRLIHKYFTQSGDKQAEDEKLTQIEMAKTEDYREGIMAFFEKRKAEFKGK